MSDLARVVLVGATGLVGRAIVAEAARRNHGNLHILVRRRPEWLAAAPVPVFVEDPSRWDRVMEDIRPDVVICTLGTTWRKAGRDEQAFRAVDHQLVVATAKAAQQHGATGMVVVSAVGAKPASRSFYLRVKGEMERDLATLGFARLDILRPGLLHGTRQADFRLMERVAAILSPVTDRVLLGGARRYRSISARTVAQAALTLSQATEEGVRVFHNYEMRRLVGSIAA
ncbi:NAD(P)H-binding protein [Porphyrobacter sp. GA68]|uniref:NAD(P)H-binding protein n=1 Tax=Porphyrobacter sp. GA68 TaxID=2883480 RepID=UPI001D189F34|nr:NAD(P)H-binding protein [Porphyrobacter sp. GA68]